MNKQKVIEKLRDDEHYYGDFGKKYLSNSDIGTLLTNPLNLGKASEARPAFLVGGYFHTAILEPDKLKKYKIIDASTRNTKHTRRYLVANYVYYNTRLIKSI